MLQDKQAFVTILIINEMRDEDGRNRDNTNS